MELQIKVWDSERSIGYKQITTFFQDFSIADHFGLEAIKDTYNRAFKEWKDNYKYLTELVLVLNTKSWQHHDEGNADYSSLYSDLYYQANDYAYEHLTGEELKYYFQTTD